MYFFAAFVCHCFLQVAALSLVVPFFVDLFAACCVVGIAHFYLGSQLLAELVVIVVPSLFVPFFVDLFAACWVVGIAHFYLVWYSLASQAVSAACFALAAFQNDCPFVEEYCCCLFDLAC